VVAAHLLAAMHAQPLDLPPVTAAMPAQFPENTSGTIAGSPGSVTSQITEGQNDGDQNDGDQNDGEQDNDVDGTLTPASGSAAVPTTPQQSDDSNL
jgi:hypothetical protein